MAYSPTQQAVGLFDLHHRVTVQYPCWDLVDNRTEKRIYVRPIDQHRKYEPKPLVDDAVIIAVTGRKDDHDGNIVQSISPVHGTDQVFYPASRSLEDVERLIQDMEMALKCEGRTILRAVMIQKPIDISDDTGPPTLLLRVVRESLFGFGLQENIDFYDASMLGLQPYQDRAWVRMLDGLIWGFSERQIRSARHQHSITAPDQGTLPFLDDGWRPERMPNMGNAVDVATFLLSKEEKEALDPEERCPICFVNYVEDHKEPVVAVNQCGHRLHRECLISWTKAPQHGMSTKCYCGSPLFNSADVKHIKFGETKEGVFLCDRRFLRWELQEKSFADIDLKARLGPHHKFKIDGRMAFLAFQHLVEHAKSEPLNFTASFMNPVYYKEFRIMHDAIVAELSRSAALDTRLDRMTRINNSTERAILEAFEAFILKHKVKDQQAEDLARRFDDRSFFRPGFLSACHLLVLRTMGMLQHRTCQCKIYGWHRHGHFRMFWNPELSPLVLDYAFGDASSEQREFTFSCPVRLPSSDQTCNVMRTWNLSTREQ